MADAPDKDPADPPPRRYVWPWFLLAAVLAAILLAVIWMNYAIERTRRIRDLNAPARQGQL